MAVRDGRVLVVLRERDGRRYAVLPGGGVEPGETPQQACLRELREETGLDGELVALLPVGLDRAAPVVYLHVDTGPGLPELAADAPSAAASARDTSAPPSGTDRVVVLTGLDTKGLEFDGIVVVRPQEIEDEALTGRATLYVVLTRATQLLTTIS